MGNGSGVSRGDRDRNARLERLRALVPVANAIAGTGLAGEKQMVVVTDYDARVIARRTFRCRAWDLARRWSPACRARPGRRWRVLGQLAAGRPVPFACVQPLVTSQARRTEDLACYKTDEKDAVLIIRRGGQKPCLRIVRGLFAALGDRAGVIANRPGALERVQLLAEDWQLTRDRLAGTERPMTAVLGELGLTGLVTSMTGLSAIGAAAILAGTGDPGRFATARAVAGHAGLAPREKLPGAFACRTRLTGQGRPGLRLAAWRAVWGAQRANPVCRARCQHLTGREQNKLATAQAQTVLAAAILRQLHAVITTGQAWDPVTAATAPGGTAGHSPPDPCQRHIKLAAGASPPRH